MKLNKSYLALWIGLMIVLISLYLELNGYISMTMHMVFLVCAVLIQLIITKSKL